MTEKLCEIVQDLLPIYIDGCCSEGSCQMVEEHLECCQECNRAHQEMLGQLPLTVEPPVQEEKQTGSVLKKGFQKIRRRWILSLATVIAAIPLCVLGWNQFRGIGVCFTNLHEMWIANAFLSDLKNGDYESAYRHMDVEALRERWLEDWFDEETLSNIKEDGLEIFLRSAQELKDAGNITRYEYLSSQRQQDGFSFEYTISVDGKGYRLSLYVGDKGVQSLAGPQLQSVPGQLTMWSEYLWEHYEGCYFDWDTGEYVYDAKKAP